VSLHLPLKGGVVEVLDGLHASGVGGLNIFDSVVEEEDVGRRNIQAFGGVMVDGKLGLGDVEDVGPGVVVEVLNPGIAGEQPGLHSIAHVREDAGGYARSLERLGPLKHRLIDPSPEVDVGGDEGFNLRGSKQNSCVFAYGVPKGLAGEVTPVVGVAVGPVAVMELIFGEACDGAHLLPGCGIGRAGENHTVVEEDRFYRCHVEFDFTDAGLKASER